YATKSGKLLAAVEAVHGVLAIAKGEGGVLRIEGVLPADADARCVVYLPRWADAKVEDLPEATATETLARATADYWRTVMADAMKVEVPDALLNNLIPASQVHCLLAGRNEDGKYVSAWIGSINYGPLESEAHSVIRG